MTTEMKTIERIRASYEQKEITKFDELKNLDKKVKRPAKIFAYIYGSLSSLVLGTGMCLAMKVIGASLSFAMPIGIGVGLVGIALALSTYPIFKAILKRRKNKYAKQIFELSDSLLNK
ncbi:MAG: dihydropteridine reductase [Clostridia bacterium]|nr:dihydropteridine reductase [Clostridia bacterium]